MLCQSCKTNPIDSHRSKRMCSICLDKEKDRQIKYYHARKNDREFMDGLRKSSKKWADKLYKLGMCIKCGKNSIYKTSKNYCESCLEKSRYKARIYREQYPDRVANSKRNSQSKKPQLYNAIKKKYSNTHKDGNTQRARIRRARRKQSGGTFTLKEWKDLLVKYDHRCLRCGSKGNIQADHIVPIVKGGRSSIDNIQPLCWTCNRWKWTKIIDFRPFGNSILEWT